MERIDMLTLECPGCHKVLSISAEHAGLTGKCNHCGTHLAAPLRYEKPVYFGFGAGFLLLIAATLVYVANQTSPSASRPAAAAVLSVEKRLGSVEPVATTEDIKSIVVPVVQNQTYDWTTTDQGGQENLDQKEIRFWSSVASLTRKGEGLITSAKSDGALTRIDSDPKAGRSYVYVTPLFMRASDVSKEAVLAATYWKHLHENKTECFVVIRDSASGIDIGTYDMEQITWIK